ncbi:LuxR C-terminal-related transcriptional regulator [Streptomyces sp. NPDC053069]|uniref:helix-turn-helix transcriptional regulator n=1 Tax=Streptomyces sp. NPDC053069 TaxID=3365695 RepID=UPI0037D63CFB
MDGWVGLPRLDGDATAVYECALRQDSLDVDQVVAVLGLTREQVEAAAEKLKVLHLLRPKPGDPSALVAVSPDAAAGELLAPVELAQRRRQQAIDGIRVDLAALTSVYRAARRERGRDAAVSVVPEVGEVLSLLRNATARCTEISAIQPARRRTGTLLSDVLPRDLAMLERGVTMRSLVQHTARYDLEYQSYVEQVAGYRAEMRTLEELPDRMIIFDRETVFLPTPGNRGGAAVVHEPSAVQYLCGVFDHLWDVALPFEGGAAVTTTISDLVKKRIVRLLAEGAKDEVIARRLAMSVRTVRKHISEITQTLGAESRFQAGVLAARAGLTEYESTPD